MSDLRGLPRLVLERTKAAWLVVVLTAGLVGGFVLGAGLLARGGGIGVRELSQDPAWTAGLPFYYGALGAAGVLCWWSGGVVCVFAASLLDRGRGRTFLWCSGLLTFLLAADDEFQFHEIVVPMYLGVSEVVVYAAYALLATVYFAAFLPVILKTQFALLIAAGSFLGFSVLFDVLLPAVPGQHLIEDGAKLVGIALWTIYYVRTSHTLARGELDASAAGEPAKPLRHADRAARLGAAWRV